jgi:hypothetical protein
VATRGSHRGVSPLPCRSEAPAGCPLIFPAQTDLSSRCLRIGQITDVIDGFSTKILGYGEQFYLGMASALIC